MSENQKETPEPKKGHASKNIPMSLIIKLAIGAAIFVGLIFGGKYLLNGKSGNNKIKPENVKVAITMTSTEDINKLYTTAFAYNGVAEAYKDGNEKNPYYIYYKSVIKVGINGDDIKVDVDDTAKTIKITLPKLTLSQPDIDAASLEYFKDYADLNMNDVLNMCQEDAAAGAEAQPDLYANAKDNLKSSIEALLKPITTDSGYTLIWNTDAIEAQGKVQ